MLHPIRRSLTVQVRGERPHPIHDQFDKTRIGIRDARSRNQESNDQYVSHGPIPAPPSSRTRRRPGPHGRLRQRSRQRLFQDQPFADLSLEVIGALPAMVLERTKHSPQHTLVMRVRERNALELSDWLALQRLRNCNGRSPLPARGHALQLPHSTRYNLIDYFERRPHRTLTGIAQHGRVGRRAGQFFRSPARLRASCSFTGDGAVQAVPEGLEQSMRKSLAATLTLGALLSAATVDTVQACWWDCKYRQRPARVYGYGPVYGYGAVYGYAPTYWYSPSSVLLPKISRLGPTSSITDGFEYGGVRMASSWWRSSRRR